MGVERSELERINREEIDAVRRRLHDVSSVQAAHTALLETADEGLKQLREENIRDHSEVVAEIRGLRAELDGHLRGVHERISARAEATRVDGLEIRTDSLEGTRDKGRGIMMAVVGFQSILLVVTAVLSVLAATGQL